jgi:CubicO group peptidase (beta-lactamase class C family)
MKRRAFARIAMLLISLASVPVSAVNAATLPAATVKEVEASLSATVARWNAPGLSAAIVADNRLVWSRGLGLAETNLSACGDDTLSAKRFVYHHRQSGPLLPQGTNR